MVNNFQDGAADKRKLVYEESSRLVSCHSWLGLAFPTREDIWDP